MTTPVPGRDTQSGPALGPEGVQDIAKSVAERTPVPTPTPDRIERQVEEVAASLGLAGKSFLGVQIEDWLNLAISALLILLGYFLGTSFLSALFKWIVPRTATDFDDTYLLKIVPDLKWLVVLLFTRYAVLRLDFFNEEIRKSIEDVFFVLGLLIFTIIGIRLIAQVAVWYQEGMESDEERLSLDPVTTALKRIAILVLLILMLSIGLTHFGINLGTLSITILVFVIVVSLGARDAIADAISGFIILLDRPFRIHDGILLKELDAWGDVIEIGTRTTRILTRDNREMIIPNTRIVNSRIINYTYPDPEYRMQVDIGIAYDSDLDTARQVIIEALRKIDGILPDKDVEVLFIGFDDTTRKIRVRWWIADYHQDWDILNLVCQTIESALHQAGIRLPFITSYMKLTREGDQSLVDEQKLEE
jgi:small-conductance mechanosensitive channel